MDRNNLIHLRQAQESLVRAVAAWGDSIRVHCEYSDYSGNTLRRSRMILQDLDRLERSIAELRSVSRDVIRVVVAGGVPHDIIRATDEADDDHR